MWLLFEFYLSTDIDNITAVIVARRKYEGYLWNILSNS